MASTTGIKLGSELRERLKVLGEKLDRAPHWIMKTAIEQYLSQQEQYWREREEDTRRWEHHLMTGDAVAHERVSVWLESVGTAKEQKCPR